jgi:hypothetical protein
MESSTDMDEIVTAARGNQEVGTTAAVKKI